ncbi:hypothetical protein AAVH_20073 [Aphelenchoides avenae]|nr:hypothetical protein AAVH_20073 [Aphelenchus avenae]
MPQLSPAGAPLQSPTSGDFHQAALASFLNAQDIVDPAEAAMSDDEWEHPQDPHQPGTSRGILRKGQRGGGRKRKANPPADQRPKRSRLVRPDPRPDITWQWPGSDQAGGAPARPEAERGSLTAGISVEGRPLSHFVEERRRYTTYVRQYGVDGDVVQFRLRNLDQVTQPELVIARLVEQMRAQALQRHPDAILIGLNFLGGEIEAPFDVHMRHPDQNTAAALFNGLAPFFESYGTDILYSDLVEMCVTTVSPPDGASCDRAQLPDPLPRGVVPIVNPRDSFCLARAVVVGMRYHEMTTDQFTLYSGVGSDQQLQDALQLMRDARVPTNQETYGLTALKRMQRYLDEAHPRRWRLAFFRSTCRNSCLEWRGAQRAEHLVSVLNLKGHFHALVSPGNLFGPNARFCVDCNRPIRRDGDHRRGCPNACADCQREGLQFPCKTTPGGARVACDQCGLYFANRNCYEYHLLDFNPQTGQIRKPICERRRRCKDCGKIYRAGTKNADGTEVAHECKSTKCRRCGVDHEPNQEGCFIRSKADDPWHPAKVVRYVFWDAETTFDRVVQVGNIQGQKHVANQIVAHIYCEKCMDNGTDFAQPSTCKYCKQRRVFFGPLHEEAPMSRFITWLFCHAPNTRTIAIAHNSGKFDSHLALEEILTRPKLRVTRNISQGRKIYELVVRHEKYEIHFKDSVNFFHSRLADLPKAFGFRDDQKGFFPYRLNTTGNERLRLPRLPDPAMYDRDDMDAARQAQLDEWYAAHQNDEFVMSVQLKKYCEQDVVVLRKACCAFRQKFLEICELDPFVVASTSAKLALEVFLRKHLDGDDVIAANPEHGLTPRRNQTI